MAMPLAANLSLLFEADVPWPERCQRVAARGFEFAEILFPYDQPMARYRQCLEAAGLKTVLINTPVNNHFGLAAVDGAQAQFQAELDQAISVATSLGAGAIHVMAGRSQPGIHLSLTTLLGNLEHAVRRAEGAGLVLLLEALNRQDAPGYFYSRPAQVVAVLDALPCVQLRQQFDIYHTLREGLPLMDELQRCRTHIAHVQIAQPPSRSEPVLHQGDMLNALQALANTGYQGWLGCEYRPANGFENGLDWLAPLRDGSVVRPLAEKEAR